MSNNWKKYIPAGTLLLVLATSVFYVATPNEFKNAPAKIGNCDDPAVTAVIYSIRNYPTRWDSDNYSMWHDNDVSIWVANEDYGMSLTMNSRNASPDDYNMSDECKIILYDTTQTWLRNTLNENLRS